LTALFPLRGLPLHAPLPLKRCLHGMSAHRSISRSPDFLSAPLRLRSAHIRPLSCGLRCRVAGLGLKWLARRLGRRIKAYGGLRLCPPTADCVVYKN